MYRRLLREYLSLTLGERRGMQVLSLLIILLVLFRALTPLLFRGGEVDLSRAEKEFMAFRDSLALLETRIYPSDEIVPVCSEPFPFDPNTASLNELVSLGLSFRTARTLINYRDAGGEFRRDSDLLRVYGLETEDYSSLKDYIRIEPDDYPEQNPGDSPVEGWRTQQYQQEYTGSRQTFELNKADSMQLLSVYGIGPVFARRIIRYREALGGFYSKDQLLEVFGLDSAKYSELSQSSFIDTGRLSLLDLNEADAGDFSSHPYLDRYQSHAIIAYRSQMGSFNRVDEVLKNGLLPDSVFLRIRPYLCAGDR